jgi:hypothetical protein
MHFHAFEPQLPPLPQRIDAWSDQDHHPYPEGF